MQDNNKTHNVKEVLREIDKIIEIAKSNDYEKHLLEFDVEKLLILRDGIEKYANGGGINLNEELNIPALNKFYRAQNTYLKIAASLCNSDVVEYLLQNGAKPSNNIVFFPVQFQNQDLQNVLKVLKNYGADINPTCTLWNNNYSLYYPAKIGHTLLFWANRKHHEDLATALTNNNAKMSPFDILSLPGAKLKDEAAEALNSIIPHGC